jgi:hypothetical protein
MIHPREGCGQRVPESRLLSGHLSHPHSSEAHTSLHGRYVMRCPRAPWTLTVAAEILARTSAEGHIGQL